VVETLTGPQTLALPDHGKTLLLDGTAAFTVTLPPVADIPNGWRFDWEMIDGGGRDGSGNRVTFDGNAAELVGFEQTFEALTVGHRGTMMNIGGQFRVVREDLPLVRFFVTATGAYTHTRPKGQPIATEAGVTGGGGTGGRSNSSNTAGGGEAGHTAIKHGWDISGATSLTGTVGAGGAAVTVNGNGNAGADTTMVLTGPAALTLTGIGGDFGQGNGAPPDGGGESAGTATNGDLNLRGGPGENGTLIASAGNGGDSHWSKGTKGAPATQSIAAILGAASGGTSSSNNVGKGGDGVAWVYYGS